MDISMVRGDTLALSISGIKNTDGTEYTLKETDVVYLDVKKYATDKTAVFRKSVNAFRSYHYIFGIVRRFPAENMLGGCIQVNDRRHSDGYALHA